MNFPTYALAASLLLGSASRQSTCLDGTIAPRVTKADLTAAQESIGVKVEQVERLPYDQCRTIMRTVSADASARFVVGHRFVVETRCADANTLIMNPDEWLYSDVPVAGQEGRVYIPRHGTVPPGWHYIAAGTNVALAELATTQSVGTAPRCAG